ncbi:MAG: hypothetical protein GXP35_00245 [Actinobacteria bacterium]|nr:hypothetical protein [Actinomycetota bacterium]
MIRKQSIEFGAHSSQRSGLYFDEPPVSLNQIDNEAIDSNFEAVARTGVMLLERRMKRSFVDRPDVRLGRGGLD